MHDVGDPLIPVGESRKLVAALAQQSESNYRYTETAIFEHVRPGSDLQPLKLAAGALQLYRHMYGVLRMAASHSGGHGAGLRLAFGTSSQHL